MNLFDVKAALTSLSFLLMYLVLSFFLLQEFSDNILTLIFTFPITLLWIIGFNNGSVAYYISLAFFVFIFWWIIYTLIKKHK